ncbi:hypothetical protein Smp_161150 [Schistosoma mansoni]|uniref:hypothetical protein n=1 Tax=Schistosoma mansoni TaxID=6183 RepID=UPI00022DCAC4|nr:hypothetical protein Smp_161150 [Schistosoma mansoni]|eukprot:XP_018655374.1 hypothetical protein Smp_161150 [Schistosoma mansoni]
MSQLRSSTSSIPPDLRVDLSEIVEDLLAFHYDDICSSSIKERKLSRKVSYMPFLRRENFKRMTLDDEIPSELRKIFDSFTSIDECSLNTSEEMKTSSATKTLTSDELSCRREKIIQLFSLNHLNEVSINDREEVVIHNVVFIKPPYNVDCCSGKNMIILDRVKNLIGKLEEDRNNEVE